MTGALVGARVGVAAIPKEWRDRVVEFPRSLEVLHGVAERLAVQLAIGVPGGELPYGWPFIPVRNLIFLSVVLCHGFRRLFPPY